MPSPNSETSVTHLYTYAASVSVTHLYTCAASVSITASNLSPLLGLLGRVSSRQPTRDAPPLHFLSFPERVDGSRPSSSSSSPHASDRTKVGALHSRSKRVSRSSDENSSLPLSSSFSSLPPLRPEEPSGDAVVEASRGIVVVTAVFVVVLTASMTK